ncbi:ferrous iron transport protein A [Novosphingobium sp. FSY-8]|uniref:Ferrous iron transport protein A n=1 Tax=Novosphingobium ovatum TaxID=1908523 RepID=A0ABW9XFK6_9SPHN|nr:ferrous iron transport protein A [Novosphingobium ovatum]
MTLDNLPTDTPARISAVDWSQLVEEEARRLRALGLDVGAVVRVEHRGVLFGRDPLAIRIGRMMVALRRVHACAMSVEALVEVGA